MAEFCLRHHVRRLALYGFVLRGDFRPDSDVDVLVEYEPGFTVGMLRMGELKMELFRVLGPQDEIFVPPRNSAGTSGIRWYGRASPGCCAQG